MTFEIIFAASGALIAVLLIAKVREQNREKTLLLRLISLGDERVRVFSHRTAHLYSDGKDRSVLFFTKQLPLRLKTASSKAEAFIQDRTEMLAGAVRESKFMKKNDGLPEFFKTMSDRENGEIHEELSEDGKNASE